MKTFYFTTSISNEAALNKVKQLFDTEPGIISFNVNLKEKNNPMEVTVDEDVITERRIKERLKTIGYYAKTYEKTFFQKLFGK